MSALTEIRQTLENNLDSDVTLPTLKAWENYSVNPSANTSWLRTTFVPTGSSIVTLGGSSKVVEHRGLFVVDVFTSEGIGPSSADDHADTILTLFSPGQTITFGARTPVTLLRAEKRQGSQSAPFYQIPVDITWYGYETITN